MQTCPFSTFLFSITLKVLDHTLRQEKNKSIQIGQEETKVLFVDGIIVYIENLIEYTEKLLI